MMEKKLNFEEIKSLIRGAVSIVKTEDGIQMQRFTDPQFHAYDNNIDHQNKTRASAGMVMDFITNAKRFVMNYQIRYGSSRVFSYFDVTVNDVPYSFQGTDDYKKEPERTLDLTLNGKENHIRIYFPCLTQIVIRDVSLYDGNNKKEIVLDNPEKGIYFNSGVWCELSNFKKGTVVLALASEPYFEEEYIRNFEDYMKYIKDKKHYESNDDSRHTT